MSAVHRRLPGALSLMVGVAIGWALAHAPSPRSVVRASGGDRWGDSILTTGPIDVRYSEGRKVQIAEDAIYYLDYKGGRLLATVPSFQQSTGPAKMLGQFAERDLVADFKIDVDNGARPHFLMTTGSIGIYGEGWSPLFVFEATTNQVAVYKFVQQMVGNVSRPRFELVEIRPIGAGAPASASR